MTDQPVRPTTAYVMDLETAGLQVPLGKLFESDARLRKGYTTEAGSRVHTYIWRQKGTAHTGPAGVPLSYLIRNSAGRLVRVALVDFSYASGQAHQPGHVQTQQLQVDNYEEFELAAGATSPADAALTFWRDEALTHFWSTVAELRADWATDNGLNYVDIVPK